MPRGKKRDFKPRTIRITAEVVVPEEEYFGFWTDPEQVSERLDDGYVQIIEVVCKDLGEVEDA